MDFDEIKPHEYSNLKSYMAMEPQGKGYLEGYAKALSDVMWGMTGDSPCNKSYDPMLVQDGYMYSYTFDMKDGGRRHKLSDYKDFGEIKETLLYEALDWIIDDTE